jgi:hypothetical protein
MAYSSLTNNFGKCLVQECGRKKGGEGHGRRGYRCKHSKVWCMRLTGSELLSCQHSSVRSQSSLAHGVSLCSVSITQSFNQTFCLNVPINHVSVWRNWHADACTIDSATKHQQRTERFLWPLFELELQNMVSFKHLSPTSSLMTEYSPIFNNSVRTSKKTQHFTITKINWLMPHRGNNCYLHRESYKKVK